jgi:putative copper resistance protein D
MDGALIACRFLQFAAAMLLFGTSTFQAALAPPALAHTHARPLKQVVAAGSFVIAVTAVLWLALQSGEMGDGWRDVWNPDTLAAVLFGTDFGHVWQWHLVFSAVLVALALLGRHDAWPISAVLGALLLVSLGLVGHAAAQSGGIGWLYAANQAVHLLMAGFWLGSLVPLVLCLRMMDANANTAARRFSALGHIAVTMTIATGGLTPVSCSAGFQPIWHRPFRCCFSSRSVSSQR